MDDDFRDTLYNTAITLTNLKCSEMGVKYLDSYLRPVYLIMAELNHYGFIYHNAIPDRKSFMLFDNVDSKTAINVEDIKTGVSDLLNINTGLVGDIQSDVCVSLYFMYTNFLKESDVFNKFKNKITFYWKGGVTSLEEVYTHATSSITLSPHTLFRFYEFLLKFYCVAFYHEINQFYIDLKAVNKSRIVKFEQCLDEFSKIYLPEKMKPLVENLINDAKSTLNEADCSGNTWHPDNILTAITNEWLIVTEPTRKISFKSHFRKFGNDKDVLEIDIYNLENIYTELKDIVENIQEIFTFL